MFVAVWALEVRKPLRNPLRLCMPTAGMAPEKAETPAAQRVRLAAAVVAATAKPSLPTPTRAASVQATPPPLPHPDTAKVDGSAPAGPVMHKLYPWVVNALRNYMGTTGFTQFVQPLSHQHRQGGARFVQGAVGSVSNENVHRDNVHV